MVGERVCGVLGAIQGWLGEERFGASRLIALTCGAVSGGPADRVQGLASAGVWGLLRVAQSEHPGRFVVLDVDGRESAWGALADALACEEPQLAVREGQILVPRLKRAEVQPPSIATGENLNGATGENGAGARGALPDWRGTLLITGGTGALGGLVARHLVLARGLKSVVLASRRGESAPAARALREDLDRLGARVEFAACDVSSREALEEVVRSIPAEYPLRAVVHAAGVLEDGVVESLTPSQTRAALAAKVSGAWHLHELTEALELDAFVMFSSAAATFGTAGQGAYAAANAFLDSLAAYRRARDLAGTSIAWGMWEQGSEMLEGSPGARARLERLGVLGLSSEEGLALFEQACAGEEALAIPIRLDGGALRAQARSDALPRLLLGLVNRGAVRPRATARVSLAARLASVPEQDREVFVRALVRAEAAGVLGHEEAERLDVEVSFKELGFDSLSAVELRNRLRSNTGLPLASTVVFDHRTLAELAGHSPLELTAEGPRVAVGESEQEGTVREALASIPLARLREAGLLEALLGLAENGGEQPAAATGAESEIDELDVESLVRRTLANGEALPDGERGR